MISKNIWPFAKKVIQPHGHLTEPLKQETGNRNSFQIIPHDITDTLIENTGRFCERHQSDLLIDINRIKEDVKEAFAEKSDATLAWLIGIRRDGVDGNSFVCARLRETGRNGYANPAVYYRRLYLVLAYQEAYQEEDDLNEICLELHDISCRIIHAEDIPSQDELDTGACKKEVEL